MMKCQLIQVNYTYGDNAFLPYSAGCLQAACVANEQIRSKFEFGETIFQRQPIDNALSLIQNSNIVGFSSYIWNWEYNKLLAGKLRQINPTALIIFGGPQVPVSDPKLFSTHLPFVDVVVVGEGEITFQNLLIEIAAGVSEFKTPGLLVPNKNDLSVKSTGPAERLNELGSLKSPYELGIFDDLVSKYPEYSFQASQETHRGCPYACTFCDWGSATMSRVRRFPRSRIYSEFEWMGKNRIELIYNCDANYGLFPDDIDLTKLMIDVKQKYGFPKKFRAAFAKNSNQRVFEIASMLNDQQMCKGITLSLQSTDQDVLQIIKRKNMKVNLFSDLVKKYRSADIPTYTEIILGLPGETIDTFCHGIEELITAGQHDSINIYHAMMLPNAELNTPEQRHEHQLETVEIPLLLLHGCPDDEDILEKNEIIISTSTMSFKDWCESNKIATVVQAFHCMNLTQKLAKGVHAMTGTPYVSFYKSLIEYLEENQVGPWSDLAKLDRMCTDIKDGVGSFDFNDRTFGNLVWPVEEIFFLRSIASKNDDWIEKFLVSTYNYIPMEMLSDLIKLQSISTIAPEDTERTENLQFDLVALLDEYDSSNNWSPKLPINQNLQVRRKSVVEFHTLEEYAREVVWYGRKGTAMEYELEVAK
jgi:putative methyltransferase